MENNTEEIDQDHLDYIDEIKRQLVDVYLFKGVKNPHNKVEYITQLIPDGIYPMIIKGKTDNVFIKEGMIYPYNFD